MHVWLPHPDVETRMGGLPPGVSAEVWDGSDNMPSDRGRVEVLIVPLMPGQTARLHEVVKTLPNLRFMQSLYAGVEWISPTVPPGVLLANTGEANAKPVAEWVVATLLSHLRELPRFAAQQRESVWRLALTDTLAYKRVTILGNGPIARALHAMLLSFGAEVTVFARTSRSGVRAIDELSIELPTTDILVALTPLTDATRGLVGADVLALLPTGAIVVNAARGPVVDTDALVVELQNRRLHAILDVTDPEPLPAEHPLWDAPQCTITPHFAGATTRYFDNVYPLIRTQLERLIAGEPPQNLIELA